MFRIHGVPPSLPAPHVGDGILLFGEVAMFAQLQNLFLLATSFSKHKKERNMCKYKTRPANEPEWSHAFFGETRDFNYIETSQALTNHSSPIMSYFNSLVSLVHSSLVPVPV